MAKKKNYLPKFFLVLTIGIVIVFGILAYKVFFIKSSSDPTILVNTPQYSLLTDVAVWYPSAQWSLPAKDTVATFYGMLPGLSMHAQITSDQPTIGHFEDVNNLTTRKFLPNTNLEADGAGSSAWGYIKELNNTKQVLLFSYKTRPSVSSPDQPLQFSCPCKIDINVFVSNVW